MIYDAAHTFGVKYRGRSLATYGDTSILSFHATKLYNTIEGGALVYSNPRLDEVVHALINFGIVDEVTVNRIGGNSKMNEFQAAMGLLNLEVIDELIKERRELTLHYRERLDGIPGIRYQEPEKNPDVEYNYAYMPVEVEGSFGMSRDTLYAELKRYNIFARRYFYPLICDYGCYRDCTTADSLEVSKHVSDNILCLPLYNGLSPTEIDYICDAISAVRDGK